MFSNDKQLEKLTEQVAAMVSLQRDLLKKLEAQQVLLGSIAKFTRDNSADTPAFGSMGGRR